MKRMYDPVFKQIVIDATERVHHELAVQSPWISEQFYDWMKKLAGSEQPADYFLHPGAFIFLLVPWWLECSLGTQPDMAFQSSLAYSSISAYYYIRLIDNLMDAEENVATELQLLPTINFLLANFQFEYQRY